MDFHRNGRTDADTRCELMTHQDCAACGSHVVRRMEHLHFYGTKKPYHQVVCGDCYATTASAAIPILQAAAAAEVPRGWAPFDAWLRSGSVAILVQDSFTRLFAEP